nr:lytic transglycosylase domain-containing protein [Frigoribacterium sp. CFBP 8759]
MAGAEAATTVPGAASVLTAPGQTLTVAGAAVTVADRDAYGVTEYVPPPPPPVVVAETEKPAAPSGATSGSAKKSSSAPVAGTPDPGSAKAVAAELVAARGWGSDQYDCLVSLWQKESSWNVYASNRSSGAYGIPQALPGSKMGSVGADWQTNPATQITWGLNYIGGRYGNPCGAWAHSVANNWY